MNYSWAEINTEVRRKQASWKDEGLGEACCWSNWSQVYYLATLLGGENWERFEIGMWFG